MAIALETPAYLEGGFTREPQVVSPMYLTGSFVIDDTNDHQFKVDGKGKSKMTVLVANASALRIQTVKVYGMHAIDALIDAVGSKQIGATFTVGVSTTEYRTVADPFPFYCVQITSAAADAGVPVCTVFIDFHSGS